MLSSTFRLLCPPQSPGLFTPVFTLRTDGLGSSWFRWGFEGAYTRTAVVLVLVFLGLPFVVRTVQPLLSSLEAEMEEAAASLGATRWQSFLRVILPSLYPALSTGFALAFARGLGEYGSVVFVSGNMPFRTEIAPVLIVRKLEEFAYAEATAIATVLLAGSMLTLGLISGRAEYGSTLRRANCARCVE